MKIQIKHGDRDTSVVLPTRMIFNKTMVKFVGFAGKKYASSVLKRIPPEAMDELYAEIQRIKKKHGSWELVEVDSADGEHITITL